MSSDMTPAELAALSQMYDKLQPKDDDNEQYGLTPMQQLQEAMHRKRFEEQQRKSIHDVQLRLAKTHKIRNANRKKNKAARKARRNQR